MRDAAGRKIDFVLLKNGKPELAVACKSGGRELSRNIAYFAQRTPIARFYQVHLERNGEDSEWLDGKARILPFVKFCDVLGV